MRGRVSVHLRLGKREAHEEKEVEDRKQRKTSEDI